MLMCELCSLSVNSQEQLTQHLGGKAHAKKLRAAGLLEGGNVEAAPVIPNNTSNVQQTANTTLPKKRKSSDSEAGICNLCNIVFNSSVQAEQHYSGSKHAKKMKILQGEGETTQEGNKQTGKVSTGLLFCAFCKVQVNSMEQLEIHRQGTKHRKNVERLKSVPVTYPKLKPANPPVTTPTNVQTTLPPFESYLNSFVKTSSPETTVPSNLKG